jgi:hypothetical protein
MDHELAAQGLLEDERLRGELTDEEYGPLLDWALARLDRAAAASDAASGRAKRRRLETTLAQVRDAVDAIGRAVEQRAELSTAELTARLEPLLSVDKRRQGGVRGGAAGRVRAEIERIAARKDSLASTEIVARLVAVLDDAARAADPGR